MPTALFVSPHLDDAVFSAGGLAALLGDAGWRTVLATVFTRSVVPASGFALACQLDKGLPPEVDYMALRRAEDAAAAAILGIPDVRWLDLLEAPHRGYDRPAALFGAVLPGDTVLEELTAVLSGLAEEVRPDLVLSPQGLGNHVDHQWVAAAVARVFDPAVTLHWRDTPYAIRQPAAEALPFIPRGTPSTVPIGTALERKVAAACAYTTQIGFQFGGAEPLGAALRAFAMAEGSGWPAERFCGCPVPSLPA